jgi:hypothetical protein
MKGYHYTSLENWEKIKHKGLVPYSIYKEELESYFAGGIVNGVWLWLDRLGGLAHAGEVLYHIAQKSTFQIVHLEVDYEEGEELHQPGFPNRRIVLHHKGNIGNLKFHNGDQTAIIIPKFISIERVELIEEFDLMKAICEQGLVSIAG